MQRDEAKHSEEHLAWRLCRMNVSARKVVLKANRWTVQILKLSLFLPINSVWCSPGNVPTYSLDLAAATQSLLFRCANTVYASWDVSVWRCLRTQKICNKCPAPNWYPKQQKRIIWFVFYCLHICLIVSNFEIQRKLQDDRAVDQWRR